MHIKRIKEIEAANKSMLYDRVKLEIDFDTDEERQQLFDRLLKEMDRDSDAYRYFSEKNSKDLFVLAFLHYNHNKPDDERVTVEGNLLSAYLDIEWAFPNEWLNYEHASKRCIDFVKNYYKHTEFSDLYKYYSFEVISIKDSDLKEKMANDIADRVFNLCYVQN